MWPALRTPNDHKKHSKLVEYNNNIPHSDRLASGTLTLKAPTRARPSSAFNNDDRPCTPHPMLGCSN